MPAVEKYVKRAKALGISRAKVVSPEMVVVGNWVRLKCQYGCGAYGTCLTCPPYSPEPEYTKRMLLEYSKGLLMQMKEVDLNRESGAVLKFRNIVADLEREMFLDGHHKVFGMAAGPCEFCRRCEPGKGCKHPYEARPSMEACGIDVYQTARNNRIRLEVVKSEESLCSFLSLILIE